MLITTIAQLRAASSINVSNSIDNWLPYISDAQDMFIIPALGQSLFDALLNYLESNPEGGTQGTTPPPEPGDGQVMEMLIFKVRKALSLYALFLGLDEMSVSVSPSGIQLIQSDTHKPAPQYQIMNLKETYLTRAHRQIDLILKYVSLNAELLPKFNLPVNPCFIRNADEFQVHSDIHYSRRVFLSLLPIISSIEQKYIKPTLSADLFDALKLEFQSGTVSPDNQLLIDLVIPPLVHLTMARALLEISIDTLDWGIFNTASNTFNNIQNKTQANQQRISAMHEANERDGEAELKMLQEFLDTNASATKYALYFSSNRYAGKENAVKRADFINTSTNSIFVV